MRAASYLCFHTTCLTGSLCRSSGITLKFTFPLSVHTAGPTLRGGMSGSASLLCKALPVGRPRSSLRPSDRDRKTTYTRRMRFDRVSSGSLQRPPSASMLLWSPWEGNVRGPRPQIPDPIRLRGASPLPPHRGCSLPSPPSPTEGQGQPGMEVGESAGQPWDPGVASIQATG